MTTGNRPRAAVLDLLTLYDRGRQRGILSRTCYYWYVAMDNQTQVGFDSLEMLRERVLSSQGLNGAIQATVVQSSRDELSDSEALKVRVTEEAAQLRANDIAKEMIGTVTSRVIKFCGWIYLTLLKQICRSVQFSPIQLQTIQEMSNGNIPIVYMPLHFSHLDYILVSLILFHNNMRVPYIASGNNLSLPIVRYFIKRAGGFFIRRKLDEASKKDLIYRSVLQTYITELLKNGQSIEIFLEGTRSRSGLPNVPKSGLMSVLVDAVVEGQVSDALLVPVNISYARLIEGNFNNELLGTPKKPENLWNTIKSVLGMLCGNYGSIKIDFAQPISLKAAMSNICMYSSKEIMNNSCQQAIAQYQSNDNALQQSSWRKNISFLAEHVIYHALGCRSFMATHLVAYLLINRWQSGVTLNDLIVSFIHLKADIIARGREIAFSGHSHDVVLNALNLLGEKCIFLEYLSYMDPVESLPLSPVGDEVGGAGDASITLNDSNYENADSGIFINFEGCNNKNDLSSTADSMDSPKKKFEKSTLFVRPVLLVPDIFQLTYYANILTPMFALESVICLAVGAVTGCRFSMIEKQWELNNGEGIFEDSLPEKMRSSFLRSNLLEKALDLCDFLQLDLILCDVIVDLEDSLKDTIHDLVSCGCFTADTIGNARITHENYGLDEEENCSDDQLLKVNPDCVSQLLCYRNVLAPFVEAFALVTEQLKLLENLTPRKQFLTRLIDYAQTRSKNGLSNRVDCCSNEILSHCIYAFTSNKVITSDNGHIRLSKECQSSEHLKNLLSKICQYMI